MSSFSIALPVARDSADGFRMIKDFKSLIKQNLKMLVLTAPGERVMEPEFGVGLRNFLFQNFDDSTFAAMEQKIKEQASIYMAAITFHFVTFDTEQVDRNVLGIAINFSIPAIGASEMLQFSI